MPHEGYADPIMNDEPEFHSNIPISELTERVTRAIEANEINSIPLVVETVDGATVAKTSRLSIESLLYMGAQGRLDLRGDRTHSHRMMAKILRRGYVRIREILSPTKFLYPLLDF